MTFILRAICAVLLAVCMVALPKAAEAQAVPGFSKVFSPDTIGPGGTSTLVFTIDNTASGTGVTDLAFSDILPTVPGDVDIATPANASTTCADGVLTAPAGGGTISLSGGRLAAGAVCTVSVSVTAATVGVHTNTSGDLTSSAGNSGVATNDLTVATSLPGFTKSFAPSTVPLGGRSTLTFTINNTAGAGRIGNLDFTDNMPAGIQVASPSNAVTNCVSTSAPNTTVTAVPGTSQIILDANGSTLFPGFEVLDAGATCSVTVDVTGAAVGDHDNITALQADFSSAGSATARLSVTGGDQLQITKAFTDDPVAPGGTATLEFTLSNNDRTFPATGVAFSDNLNGMLAGATFGGMATFNDCGGTGGGTGIFSYSGGTIAAEGSCTIRIPVTIPGGAGDGGFLNTVSDLSGTINAAAASTGAPATDTLFVSGGIPVLTKTFTTPSITAGQNATMQFTITNPSSTQTMTDLSFTDDIVGFLSGALVTGGTGSNICGTGSLLSGGNEFTPLTLIGGNLPISGSCTFSVTLSTPSNTPGNAYPNTTSAITGTVGGAPVVGPADDDTLIVNGGVNLKISQAFTNSPVSVDGISDGNAVLEITIDNTEGVAAVTSLAFSDILDANLSGAQATSANSNGCGGMAGGFPASTFSYSGGSVAAGASCTISLNVSVPAGTATGDYLNTINDLSGLVAATVVSGNTAEATLSVLGADDRPLLFSKEFLGGPFLPGETTTLRYTIENPNATNAVTITFFTDTLSSALSGLAATGPATVNTCGGALSGTSSLVYVGGSLAAGGATCTIEVPVLIPAGAASNIYGSTSSALSASTGNSDPAVASLVVESAQLVMTKQFTDDPVTAGNDATLEFTITNPTGSVVNALAFSDDLDAMLSGAAFAGMATTNTCGGTGGGTGTFSYSGGSLGAGASCTISIPVTIPGAAATGSYPNSVSDLSGTIGGLTVTGNIASDSLSVLAVDAPDFSKAFSGGGSAVAGATVDLTFSITNNSTTTPLGNLQFSDDLSAMLTGAQASGGVVSACGGTLTGTSTLSFTGGSLAPLASCDITATVSVPANTAPGGYSNTSSQLFSNGQVLAGAASATLTVNALPLGVTMSFAPSTIEQFQTATLTYTLSNSATTAATAVTLSDTLPAGVTLGNPAGAATTCTGGTLSAPDGGSALSYTGGTVAASGSCTVTVSVTSGTVGSYANSTETASSSLGTSAAASATLTVDPPITGMLTIVQNTDTDGAYVFSSPTAALNFTINTAGGTGSQGPITLPAGSYAMTQATPDGVGNTRITCSDGDSTGEAHNHTLTVNLTALEAVTCTFTSISSRQKTVDTINRFLSKRADLILSSEPPSGRRIDRLKRGVGGSTPLSFANGDLNSFLPFSAQLSTASDSYSLSTSFLQMREAAASLALAHGDQRGMRHIPNYRWDAWFEAQYKKFDAGPDTGHFAIAYFGADYLVNDNLLIGALVQIDDMEDNSASLSSSVDGTGWMMGPYMTARLAPNLYFDGRVAVGTSTNNISPFNTYTDEFSTDRWMAMAGITGDFQRGNWNIQPGASLSYFEETQHAYTDSIGVAIPSQTISLGQIKIGPTFTGQFQTPDGMNYSPYMSLDAIYNFGDTKGVIVTNLDTASTDGWRGRMQAGVDFNLKNGTSISFGGSYDGIFRNQLDIWGANLKIEIPIQKARAK